jgi:O-methyltransferase
MQIPMSNKIRVGRFLKRSLQRSTRWWLPQGLSAHLVRLGYLSQLSDWLKQNPCAPMFPTPTEFWEHLIASERLNGPILYLEMGVAQGGNLRWWTNAITDPGAQFVGFDSFLGLPEDYGQVRAGTFSNNGRPPDIRDPRCSFEVGFFQQTLPDFLKRTPLDRRLVIYLDADLYSSTLYVLTSFAPHLKAGDLLVFDDFASVRSPTHVFRALMDFRAAYGVRFTPLASSSPYAQVAVRVDEVAGWGNGSATAQKQTA